jgi:membrane protease YdiL (CAAX protease family)
MSQNSSDNDGTESLPLKRRIWAAIGLPAWVAGGFYASALLIGGVLMVLRDLHVPFNALNSTILSTILAALVYLLTIGVVIGVPWLVKKKKVSLQDIGLQRLPSWTDIWMAPAGFVVYLILSAGLILLVTSLLPWINLEQVQNTGFSQISQRYEYILAFITLVVIAPFAEEILFRGYLFGKLKKFVPIWIAILITSLLFGAIHGAWNVAIDTFALSVVLCLLRVSTGSIWAPILLHMTKNGIAFYILFINPTILHTLGG